MRFGARCGYVPNRKVHRDIWGGRKAVMTMASWSFRRGGPQWGERSERDFGDLLDGRERYRPFYSHRSENKASRQGGDHAL